MNWVTEGHKVESEIGHCIDLGAFLRKQITAGHEIERDVGIYTIVVIQPLFLVTRCDQAQ